MTEKNAPRLSRATVPARRAQPGRTGIVHLGLGNFHRAHLAVYTDAALDLEDGPWGIAGVASRSRGVVQAMHDQDLLYTVLTVDPEGARLHVTGAHSDALVAADDPGRVVRAIAAPDTRIVSITVTEAGYTMSPTTGGLDLDHPAIRHDLAGGPPRSTIGQIVRGLQARLDTGGAPITVLSCDNLAGNGRRTAALVQEFAAALPAAEATALAPLIQTQVAFPNSMVDRIVPSTAAAHRKVVRSLTGLTDAIPVPAEPFSMWVVEDMFPAGRPRWEDTGVVFSDEVEGYEQLKLRLLNGTHSLIAYLGALAGHATIPAAFADDRIRAAAERVLWDEYLPSVDVPREVSAREYAEALFRRWQNTALGHRTSQVGSDGSVKLPQRVTEPLLRGHETGVIPQHIALTVAAFLACRTAGGGWDPGPHAAAMSDDAAPWLAQVGSQARDGHDIARTVFEDGRIFGENLGAASDVVDRVGELLEIIRRHGPYAAADEAGAATTAAATAATASGATAATLGSAS